MMHHHHHHRRHTYLVNGNGDQLDNQYDDDERIHTKTSTSTPSTSPKPSPQLPLLDNLLANQHKHAAVMAAAAAYMATNVVEANTFKPSFSIESLLAPTINASDTNQRRANNTNLTSTIPLNGLPNEFMSKLSIIYKYIYINSIRIFSFGDGNGR